MTTVSVSETLLADLGNDVWVAPLAARRLGWRRVYHAALMTADFGAGLLAAAIVDVLTPEHSLSARAGATAALALGWLVASRLGCAHELRSMPATSDDLRRVLRVGVIVTALAAFIVLAMGASDLRTAVVVGIPTAAALSAAARVTGQRLLGIARLRGRCLNRVVVVGGEEEVLDLVGRMRRDPRMGLEPVAACLPGSGNRLSLVRHQVPVMGDVWDAAVTAHRLRAAAVIVGAGPGIDSTVVRRLGWQLESSTADLVVAPTVSEIRKFRLTTRMLGAAPLVHVAGRERSPIQIVCKEALERTVALLALIVLAPIMLAMSLAIRLSSDGPALFRQTRVGRDGREFTLLKFRTMVANADEMRDGLEHLNICESGPLFKVAQDPRVTRVGSWL